MAKFNMELPSDLINQIKSLSDNSEKMLGEMTSAGAKVVFNNIKSNVPKSFLTSDIMNCLKITKIYKTPSDDGINTKVAFYGYFTNKKGKKTPAPLVCNVFEHGSSKNNFPVKKFLSKSFNKSEITTAMMDVQDKYLPKN
jgi:hypothetical protein